MRTALRLSIVIIALAAAYPAQARLQWVAASGGTVPGGALQGGQEANGSPLYICHAMHLGGVHPGKVRPGFSGCNIPYGGQEIVVPNYEVLVDR